MIADTNVRQITLPKVRGKHYIVEYNRLGKQKKISCKNATKITVENGDEVSFVGNPNSTTDDDIGIICNTDEVQSFNLTDCNKVTTYGLHHMLLMDNIRSLKIFGLVMGRYAMEIISNFNTLEVLELYPMPVKNYQSQYVTEDDLFLLTKLPRLKSLKIKGVNVRLVGASHLKNLSKLERLEIVSLYLNWHNDCNFLLKLSNLQQFIYGERAHDQTKEHIWKRLKKIIPKNCKTEVYFDPA